jgi:transcriptional regulator
MLYVPELFAERDESALHAFVDAYGFALLISPDAQDPPVTHLPLLLDRSRGERGVLLGHVARSNPHWRHMQEHPEVLAIFHGPHAYVSPSWYELHPSVPTWNYATVHAHGTARLMHDAEELEKLVRRLVDQYEGGRPQPWRMELPADYQTQMLRGIVGFEITISRITGKFKLSQNRPATDRTRVIEALGQGDASEQEVATLMRSRLG